MDSDKYLEGQSMQRPPLFESDSFIYWKNRFETYVKSKDLDLWHVITNGDFQPIQQNPETKLDEVIPFEKQSDDLKKRLAKNNEAKMVIYNALPRKEYERIVRIKRILDDHTVIAAQDCVTAAKLKLVIKDSAIASLGRWVIFMKKFIVQFTPATSPLSMPLKALSCSIFKNSSPISSLEFVIIGELVCSSSHFFVSSKLAIMTDTPYSISLNTPYRSVECQHAVLSSQNTPYFLEKQIRRLDCRIQYAVLGRRFDTSYPTGGYGISGDQSEQNTIKKLSNARI
ncbi:hypothetical protein Tco_0404956 [Tanacetum coccineum]